MSELDQCRVLHIDVDAFFCQVEVLRNPRLAGKPLAVQQHQDIISVNYAAKQAGVKKHMWPAEARALLRPLCGEVAHVYCEEGLRVSYRPYREASGALIKLLRTFPAAAVVEKASIDEAYMLIRLPQPPAAAAAAAAATDPFTSPHHQQQQEQQQALQQQREAAEALAEAIRQATAAQLGLTVSVGVAPNKLLAKLASRLAKPDGVHVVAGQQAVQQLLATTPVERLPGIGGRIADDLKALGVTTAAGLQQLSEQQLAALPSVRPAMAATLAGWAHGRDSSAVVDKGPPKSLQVQISLTPVPLPIPRSVQGQQPLGGGSSGGMLQPLPAGGPDSRQRLQVLLRAMAGDLLGRVMLDRHEENRWPRKLSVQITTNGPSGKGLSKSCVFPSPVLLESTNTAAGAAPVQPGTAAAAAAPVHNQQPAGVPGTTAAAAGPPPAAAPHRLLPASPAALTAAKSPAARASPAASPQPQPQPPQAKAAQPPKPPGGMLGEKSYNVPEALLAAVVTSADLMAQSILSSSPASAVVVQVHLAASSFGPYEALASASIKTFFRPVQHQAGHVQQQAGHVQQQAGHVQHQAGQTAGSMAAPVARAPQGAGQRPAADTSRGDHSIHPSAAKQDAAGAEQQCQQQPAPDDGAGDRLPKRRRLDFEGCGEGAGPAEGFRSAAAAAAAPAPAAEAAPSDGGARGGGLGDDMGSEQVTARAFQHQRSSAQQQLMAASQLRAAAQQQANHSKHNRQLPALAGQEAGVVQTAGREAAAGAGQVLQGHSTGAAAAAAAAPAAGEAAAGQQPSEAAAAGSEAVVLPHGMVQLSLVDVFSSLASGAVGGDEALQKLHSALQLAQLEPLLVAGGAARQ